MALPYQVIKSLMTGTRPSITSTNEIDELQVQPASLDCTLGDRAYRISSSFLPRENETIAELLESRTLYEFSLEGGAILEKNTSYIIPLRESLNLHSGVYAIASPKSSIGRIDVFVRILADRVPQYDTIPAGYSGPLYLEVIPLTFAVKVHPGLPMTQIRFRETSEPFPTQHELMLLQRSEGVVFHQDGTPLSADDIRIKDNVISFTADLTSRDIVGYKANPYVNHLLDLSKIGGHDLAKFWTPIERQPNGELVLEPNSFYILATKERVSIPATLAAEIAPYDPATGELRSHYAGFFDPGFGNSTEKGHAGNIVVLEVRAHSTPFRLTDGQVICKMVFEQVESIPEKLYGISSGSTYTNTQIRLSKFFTEV